MLPRQALLRWRGLFNHFNVEFILTWDLSECGHENFILFRPFAILNYLVLMNQLINASSRYAIS